MNVGRIPLGFLSGAKETACQTIDRIVGQRERLVGTFGNDILVIDQHGVGFAEIVGPDLRKRRFKAFVYLFGWVEQTGIGEFEIRHSFSFSIDTVHQVGWMSFRPIYHTKDLTDRERQRYKYWHLLLMPLEPALHPVEQRGADG